MNRSRVLLVCASVASLAAFVACEAASTDPAPSNNPVAGGAKVGPDGTVTPSGGDGGTPEERDDASIVNPSGSLSGNGCAGGTCLNPECKALATAADPGDAPVVGFEFAPAYIPNDVVIQTFDDAPDGENDPPDPAYGEGAWTAKTLKYLDANNLHFDFFMNTNNWCGDVMKDQDCAGAMVSILARHNPANHTVHHPHMGGSQPPEDGINQSCGQTAGATTFACEDEVQGVEDVVKTLSKGGRTSLTRFRAPYGEPYQVGGPGKDYVPGIVAKHAVMVGWNIDPGDSAYAGTSCANTPCPTGQKIADAVLAKLGSGPGKGTGWGIILMHTTNEWTYEATKILYGPKGTDGEVQKRGFRLGTVEDVICWKFGKHSWELVNKYAPGHTPN